MPVRPLSASLILLTIYLGFDADFLIVVELDTVVAFMLLRPQLVTCMLTPRPVISLDESELERARLSAQIFHIIHCMSPSLTSSLSKGVWRILSCSGGRCCRMMFLY